MSDKIYKGSRKYTSDKGISTDIMDVLPDMLTLYPKLHPVIWREKKNSGLKTIFNEVRIVPFDIANPHAKEQLQPLDDIEPEVVSEECYAAIMWESLQAAIYDLWDSERPHYCFTSSGYDSRLIAYAIWKLHEKHGDDWLGEVYFVEADGEAVQFRHSMELIGWDRRDCIVYNEGAHNHRYHANSLDFPTAWDKLGGMCGHVVNFRLEAEMWMQQRGLMPEDNIQSIAGYFSNEIVTTMLKDLTIYEYFKQAYRKAISIPRHWAGSTSSPFQHIDVITNQLRYGRQHLEKRTGISALILRHFAPPELADLPSPKHKTKLRTVRLLSNKLLDKAIEDYRGSWFGQQFPDVAPIRELRYDRWWAHWCVASFCEHLLGEGYTIEIKEKANVS